MNTPSAVRRACLCTVIVLFTAVGFVRADNPSLARMFPSDKLQGLIADHGQWHPFPTAGDREGWEAISPVIRRQIIDRAERYAQQSIPPLPATLYLEYKRNGDRNRYQRPWSERRYMLNTMVIAECLQAEGRFLDPITDIIWAICEESSWTLPAHIGAQKLRTDLPDTTEPIVALFSAETANCLAWTHYLLKDHLDMVSPLTSARIEREIKQRILTPYLQRDDFGWMGFGTRARGQRPNNWNPWINSNVLTATLLIETDAKRRIQLVGKVLGSLDNFYVPYPSDGSCDEGPSYWGRAGASMFDCLELLFCASDGRIDLFDEPSIGEMGRFIYRTHIVDDYFVNVGDCSGRLGIYRDVVHRYGRRIGDPQMQALAACNVDPNSLLANRSAFRSLGRTLYAVFNTSGLAEARTDSAPLVRDVWLGHEDMQLMVARDAEGSADGLYVACWGGHNGQSHNHNDVGNFILFANGRPFIIDAGKPTYTRQTFSSDRYKIWSMQSAWHNVPTVNGAMQGAGRSYGAKCVSYNAGDSFAQLQMEIAGAYPKEASVRSWIRTVRLNRGVDVRVIDVFDLTDRTGVVEQNLITPCRVTQPAPDRLVLEDAETGTAVSLHFDQGRLKAQLDRLDLHDASLRRVWGPTLTRIRLVSRSTENRSAWTLRFAIN